MNFAYSDSGQRRETLAAVKSVVVKTGSNLVREAPAERTRQLIDQIAALRARGIQTTLVTSGAIPLGMGILGRRQRPRELAGVQALAALGQCYLMRHYEHACEANGFHCAQLLLTSADLNDRARNTHVAACLRALHEDGVLPIINENDSVCVDEIKIGDNDTLAAYVAAILNADLTILLTTVDGFHETASDGTLGKRLSVISQLDDRLLGMAGSTDGNPYSTGGMITKLHAASICLAAGQSLAILDGHDFTALGKFFDGQDLGTLFAGSRQRHMRSWQRFLAFFSEPAGDLFLDAGAAEAVTERNKSLLPGGILGSRGAFQAGDTVRLLDAERRELARGVVNFSYTDLARICGAKTADLPQLLGHPVDLPEVVHKDYLVVTAR